MPLLRNIVVLLIVSVPISMVFVRLGLPTIIGFFLTGVILGPFGFGFVTEIKSVEVLADIGVVLLLFTIGLEFSLARMVSIRRESLIGGGLQVLLTIAITWAVTATFGVSTPTAILYGFIISLSSTAIVLKLLMDRGEISSAQGNLSVGVLIFQDVCVVLMVMVLHGMGGGKALSTTEIVKAVALALLSFAAIVGAVTLLIPRIFNQVVKLKNREVFVLTIVLVCFGTAWFASLLGLSLALGAFIAGLSIAESEYSHQIVAEVLPFRDTFSSLFFISIGMLLDAHYFVGAHLFWILLLAVGIIALKAVIIAAVGQILKYPLRLSISAGLILAQIGEFSFILIKMGDGYSLLSHDAYQMLLGASLVTMTLTPFIHERSSKIALGIGHYLGGSGKDAIKKTSLFNHVIIVGYGLNGRNLAQVLKSTGIAHIIVDVNMEGVRGAKAAGHHAYFADATHPEILKKLGIDRAKMLVVAISDPVSTRRIVALSREMNASLSIIVRTRYIREVDELHRLGANQVIPEEFETSVEIFARVLKEYRTPGNIIQNQIDLVRQEGYAMLRHSSVEGGGLSNLSAILEKSLMDTFYVDKGCNIPGKTVGELEVRRHTGATIIAVIRNGKAMTNPHADFLIEHGDILVLLGSHAELNSVISMLNDRCPI